MAAFGLGWVFVVAGGIIATFFSYEPHWFTSKQLACRRRQYTYGVRGNDARVVSGWKSRWSHISTRNTCWVSHTTQFNVFS